MAQEHTHTARTFLIVSLALTGAFTAYYLHTHTKRYYAKVIVTLNGASDFSVLMHMDEAYLRAWAKALAKGGASFVYRGSSYYTQGGTKIVPAAAVAGGSVGPTVLSDSNPVNTPPDYSKTLFI